MSKLTAELLWNKLNQDARGGSIVRLHFVVDADTNTPRAVKLQMQHITGQVIDLWVWDDFECLGVETDA